MMRQVQVKHAVNVTNHQHLKIFFKEELIVDDRFPESKAGQKLLKEFAEYTAAPGAGELMHSAVFQGNGNHDNEKRAREYVKVAP